MHYGLDEFCCKRRDDRIPCGAQLSHSGGYPMSQREKAGASWPGFSVGAGEPLEVGPGIGVSCEPWASGKPHLFALGVLHGAYAVACSLRGRALRFIVSSLAWPFFQSRAEGVAHEAISAVVVRFRPPP